MSIYRKVNFIIHAKNKFHFSSFSSFSFFFITHLDASWCSWRSARLDRRRWLHLDAPQAPHKVLHRLPRSGSRSAWPCLRTKHDIWFVGPHAGSVHHVTTWWSPHRPSSRRSDTQMSQYLPLKFGTWPMWGKGKDREGWETHGESQGSYESLPYH